MTVKELIEELQTYDQDLVVYQAQDAEGNSYMQVEGSEEVAVYEIEARVYEVGIHELTPELIKQGCTEEDIIDGPRVVCLWPV